MLENQANIRIFLSKALQSYKKNQYVVTEINNFYIFCSFSFRYWPVMLFSHLASSSGVPSLKRTFNKSFSFIIYHLPLSCIIPHCGINSLLHLPLCFVK